MKRFRAEIIVLQVVAALFFTAGSTLAKGQSPAPAPAQIAGPVVPAKFEKSLSVKSLKAGDTITAKTLKPVKLADGAELPKGSKLIAKVTLVKTKQEGNGTSWLTFRFDQAQLKSGAEISIHGLVVAIGPELGPKDSIGANSVMGRGGVGSTPTLDPTAGLGRAGAKDETDIALGSTLEGVGLGVHKDADWTTALQGVKRDIQLDSDVIIKVQFR